MKRVRRWLPSFLLVLPSIILVGVFVYGFIGKTVFASLARVKTKSGRVKAPGGWANYSQLLADGRYQHAMWNLLKPSGLTSVRAGIDPLILLNVDWASAEPTKRNQSLVASGFLVPVGRVKESARKS
jgi:ABC-type sugar transport system permease subunit